MKTTQIQGQHIKNKVKQSKARKINQKRGAVRKNKCKEKQKITINIIARSNK